MLTRFFYVEEKALKKKKPELNIHKSFFYMLLKELYQSPSSVAFLFILPVVSCA